MQYGECEARRWNLKSSQQRTSPDAAGKRSLMGHWSALDNLRRKPQLYISNDGVYLSYTPPRIFPTGSHTAAGLDNKKRKKENMTNNCKGKL